MNGRRSFAVVAALAAAAALLSARQALRVDSAALAARVKQEFSHAWDGYKKYAWGHDELVPLANTARDWEPGTTLLMTPVDALDTMILMGMADEAAKTREYIDAGLDVAPNASVQVFEITIR